MNADNRSCTVYGLYSSEDGVVRYIGQTIFPIEERKDGHVKGAFYNNEKSKIYKDCWIRKVINSGHEVLVKPIQENAIWNKSEVFWIRKFREAGIYNLTNHTDGGDGTLGYKYTEEQKKRRSETQMGEKNHNFGKHPSEETRKRQREAIKGRRYSEEHKKNISKARKGIIFSEEHKKNMSEAIMGGKNHLFGKHLPEEWRKNISEALVGKMVGGKNPRSKIWRLVSPEGEEFIVKGLRNFCKENKLSYQILCRIAKRKDTTHKSGWQCECLGKEDAVPKKIK